MGDGAMSDGPTETLMLRRGPRGQDLAEVIMPSGNWFEMRITYAPCI
jgi:hypothetical protein